MYTLHSTLYNVYMLFTAQLTVPTSRGGAGCLDAPKVIWRKLGMREKVINGIMMYNLVIRHLQSSRAASCSWLESNPGVRGWEASSHSLNIPSLIIVNIAGQPLSAEAFEAMGSLLVPVLLNWLKFIYQAMGITVLPLHVLQYCNIKDNKYAH